MAGIAVRGLGFLGKTLFSRWGLIGLTAADFAFNNGKITSAVGEKAAEKGSEILSNGMDNTLDEWFGKDSEIGNFLKDHWGKLATGALALGLYTNPNTQSLGLMIGVGLLAYSIYQHYEGAAKNGFNMAARDEGPVMKIKRDPTDLSSVKPELMVGQSGRDHLGPDPHMPDGPERVYT